MVWCSIRWSVVFRETLSGPAFHILATRGRLGFILYIANKVTSLKSFCPSVFRRLALWLVRWVLVGGWMNCRATADGPASLSALWPNVKFEQTVTVVLVSGARRNRNGPERSICDRSRPNGPPWWNCRRSGCSSCSSPFHGAAPPSRPVRLDQNRGISHTKTI